MEEGSDNDFDFSVETISSTSNSNESKCYKCSFCPQTCARRNGLKRHIKRFHGVEHISSVEVGQCLCLHCGFKCREITDLREHLSNHHQMKFIFENQKFNSLEEVDNWKSTVEEKNACFYIKARGNKINKHLQKVSYYKCNRCGTYKSTSTGKRITKSSGTSKLDFNCTSTLKITESSDGSFDTEICHTHYGHQKDLEHTKLSERQRHEFAAKMSLGVSREKILDSIRDNVGDQGFQRIHLVDKKELLNISNAYGLQSIQRHHNDQQSVLSWVQEWQSMEHNPVLYFKMQGQHTTEYPFMKDDDFMIIIQTESQKQLLQQFGPNGVCCDATHGTTGYDFLLSTLLVVDEYGEGQPVAWCLSTHETEAFLNIFFEKVKVNSGVVKPSWFMSDIAPQYYSAFCSVNECQPKRLLCIWHVDKAWKSELRKKVGNFEKEEEVYKSLRTVLEITNEELFEKYLSSLMHNMYSSELTSDFAVYFERYWVDVKTQWGYCFRLGDGINTNMFCEAFHRTFKYNYLKGKFNKRVDTTLVNLIKFARDKVFERVIKLTKGKMTSRLKQLHNRHISSLTLPFTLITVVDDESYDVQSEDLKRTYKISKLSDSCTANDCQLKCFECQVCSHTLNCTCPDFLLYATSCKHIHLVKRYLISNNMMTSSPLDLDKQAERADYIEGELNSAHKSLCPPPAPDQNFEAAKSKVKASLLHLLSKVEMCSNADDMDAIKHIQQKIPAITNTFDSLCQNKVPELILKQSHPANKNVDAQLKFKSVKGKRKSKVNKQYTKPTNDDKENFLSLVTGMATENDFDKTTDDSETFERGFYSLTDTRIAAVNDLGHAATDNNITESGPTPVQTLRVMSGQGNPTSIISNSRAPSAVRLPPLNIGSIKHYYELLL